MKQYNDIEKIEYIMQLNKHDKITGYKRSKARHFVIEMYNEAIEQHNNSLRRLENNEITWEELGHIQDNCIKTISGLKLINKKHKLYKNILDERAGN